MEENKSLVKKEESLPTSTTDTPKNQPLTDLQSQIEALIPIAGTIRLTPKQEQILYAPVKEEDVCIRPDGLVYLPWMEYVSRLRDAFGMSWAIIPKGNPMLKGDMIYWGFWLVVDGHLQGFAVGEQLYQPTNATMTYGDALEGAKSNALMRLCKGVGISLELWKPSFIKTWKEKYAESFPAVWPDGNPKKDKNGKQKTEWKKKGQLIVEEAPPDVPTENGNQQNSDFLKRMGEAKKYVGEDTYYEILTGKYEHSHANEVTDPNEQVEILGLLKDAYKKLQAEKKEKKNEQ